MSEEELQTRCSFNLPDSINEEVNNVTPHGMKGTLYRALTLAYLEAYIENRYILHDLADGNIKLVRKSSN